MNKLWRDLMAAALVIFGGVVVFAKLQSYDWWLIGSWKGALGVVAVTGLLIALTNVTDLIKDNVSGLVESVLWLLAGTYVVFSLFVTTNKAEFVTASVMIGVAWLAQVTGHLWGATHHTPDHYMPAH